jgi:uncharacterized protein YbjT (DUF2867 family)
MCTIFVSEATGKVGRHVVSGSLERGGHVRALVRDPRMASLPDSTKLVSGNIRELPRFAGHLDDAGHISREPVVSGGVPIVVFVRGRGGG